MINVDKDNAQEYAQNAVEYYNNALKISQNLMMSSYENIIKKDFTSFKVACKLKNITVIVED